MNGNSVIAGSEPFNLQADMIPPTVEITADKTSPTNATNITYTFTFSEDVQNFAEEDIIVTNGTKGDFSGSGKIYRLTVTQLESCVQKINVQENVCTDLAGNGNKSGTCEMIISIGPFGEVPDKILVLKGTTYTTEDNKIKLSDGREFFATPINKVAEPIVQVYFKNWSSESGTVTSPTKITANFIRAFELQNVLGSNFSNKVWNKFALNDKYYYPNLTSIIKYEK